MWHYISNDNYFMQNCLIFKTNVSLGWIIFLVHKTRLSCAPWSPSESTKDTAWLTTNSHLSLPPTQALWIKCQDHSFNSENCLSQICTAPTQALWIKCQDPCGNWKIACPKCVLHTLTSNTCCVTGPYHWMIILPGQWALWPWPTLCYF